MCPRHHNSAWKGTAWLAGCQRSSLLSNLQQGKSINKHPHPERSSRIFSASPLPLQLSLVGKGCAVLLLRKKEETKKKEKERKAQVSILSIKPTTGQDTKKHSNPRKSQFHYSIPSATEGETSPSHFMIPDPIAQSPILLSPSEAAS